METVESVALSCDKRRGTWKATATAAADLGTDGGEMWRHSWRRRWWVPGDGFRWWEASMAGAAFRSRRRTEAEQRLVAISSGGDGIFGREIGDLERVLRLLVVS